MTATAGIRAGNFRGVCPILNRAAFYTADSQQTCLLFNCAVNGLPIREDKPRKNRFAKADVGFPVLFMRLQETRGRVCGINSSKTVAKRKNQKEIIQGGDV